MGDFDFAYGALEKADVLNTGHGTMQVGAPHRGIARLRNCVRAIILSAAHGVAKMLHI